MQWTDIFIKRPVLSVVVSLLILLIGFKAATSLPIRQYPKLSNTVVNITTAYPGASADLIQGFITTPIEQAVASAEGVDYMTSSSVLGTSTIQVYIKLNFDPNQALTEVLAKVNSVKYLIPKESNDPIVTKTTGQTTAVMYLGFSSEVLSGSAISDYLTRVVQPVLSTVDGVASADILGGQTFAMRLWLDPERMAGRGVSPIDVSAAITANNFQAAAGQSKGFFVVSNVSTNTDLANVDQFKRMIVKSKDGGFVRMEDIATVELAAQSTDASVAFNGEHAIFIGVQATPQGNPLILVKGVRALFPELERNLPPSMKMKVAYDSTKFIQSSIDEVEKTLGEAILIVIVVIFLFLASLRSVIIPVVTIPLSLIGVCSLMLMMGFSINLLTLLAMVLAIGLVVDDAIVVVENIHRHLEEGKPPVQAAMQGAREIVGPVISMTITLAAVYAPIGFLGGLTGALFREFAFTLAGSVIVSGVIALTLSPMMCSVFLKSAEEGRFAKLVNRVFGSVTRWYGRRLDRSLDYRPITALFALTILGLVGFLYMHTSKELAPEEDQGIVFAVTKAPKYANIDYVDYYGAKLDKAFASFPETDLRFVLNGINGPQGGIAGMLLKPWDERKRSSIKLKPLVQAELSKIEGVNAFAFNLPPLPGGPGGLPVQMVIYSTNGFQSVYEQMNKVKEAARKSGLFIVSDSDLDFNQPEVRLKIDRSKASDLGITMLSIGNTLSTLLGGNYVNRFNLEGPLLPGDPAGAARQALVAGVARRILRVDHDRPAGPAVDPGVDRDRHRSQRADALQSAQLRHVPGGTDARRHRRPGGGLPRGPRQATAGRVQPRLSGGFPAICAGRQPACDHLRLCADHHLPGAGGAIRESARSPGHHDQRSHGDCRRLAAAVLRLSHREHLYSGRPADAGRSDQQARHPDGRVRQRTATQRGAGPALGDRNGGAGPASPDPDDDGGDGHRLDSAADGFRRGCREPVLDRSCGSCRHVDRHDVHAVRATRGLRGARDRSSRGRRIRTGEGNRRVRPRAESAQGELATDRSLGLSDGGRWAAVCVCELSRPLRAAAHGTGMALSATLHSPALAVERFGRLSCRSQTVAACVLRSVAAILKRAEKTPKERRT